MQQYRTYQTDKTQNFGINEIVHEMPEMKVALLKRGDILLEIGQGGAGDIQINDTDIHSPLKKKYQELDQELMIVQLRSDASKIPQSICSNMMRMFVKNNNSISVNIPACYKVVSITDNSDGSEDDLVSERIITFVCQKLMLLRENLMKNPSLKNLNDLLKLIAPPKGVKKIKMPMVHPLMKKTSYMIVMGMR